MAQLRDAKTSEVVYEGTPLDCVLAANELGGAIVAPELDEGTPKLEGAPELVYDDVGLGFDPDAVLKAHEEHVAGLEGAATEATGTEAKNLKAAVAEARSAGELDRTDLRRAEAAIDAARKAQDEALAAGG